MPVTFLLPPMLVLLPLVRACVRHYSVPTCSRCVFVSQTEAVSLRESVASLGVALAASADAVKAAEAREAALRQQLAEASEAAAAAAAAAATRMEELEAV